MDKVCSWIYRAVKDVIGLSLIAIFVFGGFSYYEVLVGIRSDIRQATSIANENISLTLDTFKLSLEKMNSELSSLKNLSGFRKLEQSKSRLEYAHEILDAIQDENAVIGTDGWFGSEIDKPMSARKWAASARDEARLIAYKSRDNNEVMWALSTTITKQDWLIQYGEANPIPLYEWLSKQESLAREGFEDKSTSP